MRRALRFSLVLLAVAWAGPKGRAGGETGPGRNVLSLLDAYLAPRHYQDLDLGQRLALLRSPGFRRFLLARSAPPPAAKASRPPIRFTISPEEMRLRRPFYFTLPPAVTPDGGIDRETLRQVIRLAQAQVATALWLSAGMICAVTSIACLAVGWRRTALGWGLAYSATLCFVHNGQAQILGPVGCAVALLGFVWPRRKSPP